MTWFLIFMCVVFAAGNLYWWAQYRAELMRSRARARHPAVVLPSCDCGAFRVTGAWYRDGTGGMHTLTLCGPAQEWLDDE